MTNHTSRQLTRAGFHYRPNRPVQLTAEIKRL